MNKENTDAAADILNNPLAGYKNATRNSSDCCSVRRNGLAYSRVTEMYPHTKLFDCEEILRYAQDDILMY